MMCNKTPESEKSDSGVLCIESYSTCHCEVVGRGDLFSLPAPQRLGSLSEGAGTPEA